MHCTRAKLHELFSRISDRPSNLDAARNHNNFLELLATSISMRLLSVAPMKVFCDRAALAVTTRNSARTNTPVYAMVLSPRG